MFEIVGNVWIQLPLIEVDFHVILRSVLTELLRNMFNNDVFPRYISNSKQRFYYKM